MNVLVGCEYSGIVRDAFTKAGHNVTSCDLLDTEVTGHHYKGDVRDIIHCGWDLAIFHPPCTYLANSGVRWLYADGQRNEERWYAMEEAALFFVELLETDIPHICIENPIMHKHAKAIIQDDWAQTIQPWQFGHGETKRTCLWLKNLPLLTPTNIVEGREAKVHRMPPGKNRWRERSRTYQGIADAMAAQWTEETLA